MIKGLKPIRRTLGPGETGSGVLFYGHTTINPPPNIWDIFSFVKGGEGGFKTAILRKSP